MSKHTPGPWMAFGHLVGAGKDSRIAVCVAPLVGPDASNANARLIAAAPELLDALRELVNAASEHPNGGWFVGVRADHARALLAKIDGAA